MSLVTTKVSALPHATAGAGALFDNNMLALIRRTVAKDANDDEFNVFVMMCRSLKLDPLRKQAYCFIFRKPGRDGEPEQRTLTLVTSINGFRTIADRTGNYRPDTDAADLHFDDQAKSKETNPLGLVKAVVRVFKHSHGDWHKVTAEAYWDEYAPIKEEWAFDEETRRRKSTGKRVLDTSGQWGKMPRVMLAKVAEAAALRRAFPDELSNVHEDAEIDRQKALDLTPAEAVASADTAQRFARIGGPSGLLVDWLKDDMAPLVSVPIGSFADQAMAFLQANKEQPSQIIQWASRNRHALKEFWALSPTDALALKKEIEALTQEHA